MAFFISRYDSHSKLHFKSIKNRIFLRFIGIIATFAIRHTHTNTVNGTFVNDTC